MVLTPYCIYNWEDSLKMAQASNAFCTIYKNSEFTHEVKYITVAVRFNNKWLFLKSNNPTQFRIISGAVKKGENHDAAVRRELYSKAGIVAAQVYEVAIYSISTGLDKFRKTSRNITYGKLFYAECVCLGKNPHSKQADIALLDTEPSDLQYLLPNISVPLMHKIKCWLASGEEENQLPYAFEKLCGAVTYCNDNGIIKYILIKNLSGHIGFPKGHAENNESEDDTARREVFEETGLKPQFDERFRHSFGYTAPGPILSNNRKTLLHKTAVYFVAKFPAEDIPNIKIQEEEVLNWWLIPYDEATKLLNKCTDRRLLALANSHIKQTEKILSST